MEILLPKEKDQFPRFWIFRLIPESQLNVYLKLPVKNESKP